MEFDKQKVLDLHARGVKELSRRLNDKKLAAGIAAPTLVRLIVETSKIIEEKAFSQAPRVQNNYLALISSADGLPPEKKREVLARISGELNEAMEALPKETDGE